VCYLPCLAAWNQSADLLILLIENFLCVQMWKSRCFKRCEWPEGQGALGFPVNELMVMLLPSRASRKRAAAGKVDDKADCTVLVQLTSSASKEQAPTA
jgi:hypothetical protein